jgi:hypothetical protein
MLYASKYSLLVLWFLPKLETANLEIVRRLAVIVKGTDDPCLGYTKMAPNVAQRMT